MVDVPDFPSADAVIVTNPALAAHRHRVPHDRPLMPMKPRTAVAQQRAQDHARETQDRVQKQMEHAREDRDRAEKPKEHGLGGKLKRIFGIGGR